MFVFNIGDPDEGLRNVVEALKRHAIFTDSRNGLVARFPRPVCLQYENPRMRLVTNPIRNANPFFHLFETMWMFAGLSIVKPLLFFNSQMAQYSDDGKSLRGTAYGYRWRCHWGDQLLTAIQKFQANPDERRVVLSMWDPSEHKQMEGKDFACNLQVLFSTRPTPLDSRYSHVLDMTVTNRSNDLIYGAMGSNLVHFSMLLEYMALHCGFEVGTYYQVSNNLHLYTEHDLSKKVWENHDKISGTNPTPDHTLTQLALTLDSVPISEFVLDTSTKPTEPYLREVVKPMVEAYKIYKLKSSLSMDIGISTRATLAIEILRKIPSPFGAAGIKWIENSPAMRKANNA